MRVKSAPTATRNQTGWSRRQFFGRSAIASLLATLGLGKSSSASALRLPDAGDSIYTRLLGVRPHLPGHGHTTVVGGSRMPPEVMRAMAEANEEFVDMVELFDAAGRRLAEVTGAEAGLVTSGSFASLILGAAACLTGTDRDRIVMLPHPSWPKRECLMQTAHRISYDRAFRAAGMEIVEVATREDFKNAINDNTAMICGLASWERKPDHTPDIMLPEELIAIGKAAGVPVFIDTASELPPAENLTRHVKMGADLVAISGGKGIRGPQGTGILVGRADLIEAASLHAFPHSNIGRGMKVGKEEVIGLIVALNRFVELDHEAYQEVWTRNAKYLRDRLQGIAGLTAEYVPRLMTPLGYDAVRLTWDRERIPLTPDEARQKLREGSPRIIYSGDLFITRNLENGEEVVVARRLREFFIHEGSRGRGGQDV
jgi:L-seryl-tRNA(Ser) seleniumtransferase